MSAETNPTSRGVFEAQVLANRLLCKDHYLLAMKLESFPATRSGQFVQVQCNEAAPPTEAIVAEWSASKLPAFRQGELVQRQALLRRPISLAARRNVGDGVELDLIYRVVGVGTHWLQRLAIGDDVNILGPLGNGFTIRPEKPLAVLVGGGVGIPPMIYLAQELAAAGKEAVAFCGVRTAELLPLPIIPSSRVDTAGEPTFCLAEFATSSVKSVIATDDGSLGTKGIVGDVLLRWLEKRQARPGDIVVYSCGPEKMMHGVGRICIERNIECQLAMERLMACGMGVCQSCVVKVRTEASQTPTFKLCCSDGPVFDARQIAW